MVEAEKALNEGKEEQLDAFNGDVVMEGEPEPTADNPNVWFEEVEIVNTRTEIKTYEETITYA